MRGDRSPIMKTPSRLLFKLSIFQQTMPHVKLWRGEDDITVGQLLLRLWKHEEASLGISRDPSGVILGKDIFFKCYQLLF